MNYRDIPDSDPEGSVYSKLRLKSTRQTRKSITLKWRKNGKAVKYVIYGSKCGKANKGGVLKAKKKGTCYVYAYAQNGAFKKIKVIVK